MAMHSGELETKDIHEDVAIGDEKPIGNVKEVNTTSIALAAAIAAQKPKLWSPSMIKLYMIMSVGYLVSTMNGFGMKPSNPSQPPLPPAFLPSTFPHTVLHEIS